ncbi:MAG: TetR/AcrR family transcriptional regulator [Acidobacteriales bacterium]|nr:TetR/AcrR family transcriptional regulator [Terriglobales bacterium]
MPWPNDYKSETRARIVAAAAAALRVKGVSGVGVADIMAGAGLTHGGFYAHFSSKDDLLAEALEQASCQSLAILATSLDDASAETRLHAIVDAYLSQWHVTHLDDGCPVAAVGPEVVRVGGRMKRNLGRTIRERLDWLRGLIPDARRTQVEEEQVVGALACMVGGLILARAVGGKESAALLEACRGFLHRALGDVLDAPVGTKPTTRRVKKVAAPRRKQPARKPRTT